MTKHVPPHPHHALFFVKHTDGQVDYLDIFSIHGINNMQQLDWTLKEGGCMDVLEEFRAAGKIRFIGFSTHGHVPIIKAAIASNKFDCINIHYQVQLDGAFDTCPADTESLSSSHTSPPEQSILDPARDLSGGIARYYSNAPLPFFRSTLTIEH